jgi:predicted phage gp36 major capsid-like protein
MEPPGTFEEQLRQLGAAIDRLVAQARSTLDARAPALHAKGEETRQRLVALRDDVSERWEAARPAIERALREIETALKELTSSRPAPPPTETAHREIIVRPDELSPPPSPQPPSTRD